MKYLCLIYEDADRLNAMSPAEYDALCEDAMTYEDELRRNGHLIVAEPVQPVQSATVLRVRPNGQYTVTDGPFCETKEQLGGFFLIEAPDLNDAIRIASRIPPARLGGIEVRPIREMIRPAKPKES